MNRLKAAPLKQRGQRGGGTAGPASGLRNPARPWRAFLVAFALGWPGVVAGALVGLFAGAFAFSIAAGGVIGAVLGGLVEWGVIPLGREGPPARHNPNEKR